MKVGVLKRAQDDITFNVSLVFGRSELRPGRWVSDGKDGIGQQYERIDYDERGEVTSRRILDPVCWLRYG